MPVSYMEIDLRAFRHNLRVIRSHLKNVPVLAVIKANAYGHVAGCGQDIPGKPVGYGIRIDFLYPEYRSLGYSYIDRVGA